MFDKKEKVLSNSQTRFYVTMLTMLKDLTIISWVCHNFNNLGCKVEFENNVAKIYDTNGRLIGRNDQTRINLFYLDIEDATCLVVKFDDVWLWNKSLCHVNFDNLSISVTWEKLEVFLSWRILII